jgi:MFS family permease
VLADLMRGSRYNVSQGAVATAQGIGASLSNTVAGLIVVGAGYNSAFLTLAAVALVALIIFLLARDRQDRDPECPRSFPGNPLRDSPVTITRCYRF